ncbi:MAG: DHA2 family efflux MFS transporter permease subunit [Streptosporangiales bacterium]|nr:DHA2 family efflux MFS transporter permease subunit [Streptosporangiales bacterium]
MAEPSPHPRRWYILGVLVVSLLVVVLDNTVLNVAMRTIADPHQGLGATHSELEWAINSYTLVFAGLLFTWGVIGDRVGRKRILMLGLTLFGLASLISAYAQTPEQLIWARAFMGVGGAAVMPQTLSIITNVFDERERGRAIGIWAGSVGLAIAIGPIVGGALLTRFWWGSVFLINVPIIVIGLIAMVFIVPESRNPRPGRLDPLGVLLSIAGLVSFVYGIIEAGQRSSVAHPEVYLPLLGGAAILVAFFVHEARSDHPSLDVRLFRDPRFAASAGAVGLIFFAMAGSLFIMTFYLQSVRGYTPLEAGLLSIPVAVAQLTVSPISSSLVRRFGARAVCGTGLSMVSLALLSYAVVTQVDSPIWWLEVAFFVMGVGMAMTMPPTTESIMSAVPREKAGAASAVQNIVRQVSTAIGVAVLGSVVSISYRGSMADSLSAVPAPLREHAGESIEGTMALAGRLGAAGRALVEPAREAYVAAMHITAVCAGVIAALGVVVVLIWLPGRRRAAASDAEPGSRREPAKV